MKYNIIDLFCGCGGLLDGFLQTNKYQHLVSIDWELRPVETLRKRLLDKWNEKDANKRVLHFDIQRTNELLEGYNDKKYGQSVGMNALVGNKFVDMIIGGPPCQAYSVAGRISDKNNMKNDYRNYLFEYYLKIVKNFNPKLFVFENVPGMLSAMPDGTPIIDLIRRDINKLDFEIIDDIKKYAVVEASKFGVPQRRKRIILIGLNKKYFKNYDIQTLLKDFYDNILKCEYQDIITVREAISDLPKLYPLDRIEKENGKKYSHSRSKTEITWHIPRFVNDRDMKIYSLLAKDLETGANKYCNTETLCELYNTATGANTKVHKYHVLKPDVPSTTILAHLYKDGMRFIHYDSLQARSITVREAARLQSFPDDFNFVGTQGDAYKMIGNAVPCKLAFALANALDKFLKKYKMEDN